MMTWSGSRGQDYRCPSAHLACLPGCGYVQARRAGRNAFCAVADPRVAGPVTPARSMAADNAAALAACVQMVPAGKPL